MIVVVLSGFVLALLAPSLYRLSARWAGCVFSIFPAVLALWFLSHMGEVVGGHGIRFTYPWIPAMGLELSFNLDGLGLLFALAITVVGTLIIAYAGSYLHGHPSLPRFYLFILMFMASMLGVVLSDNLIALFIFWELTSVTSYFLIGFEHDKDTARAAALQALIVTGSGGLALMAGVLLMGQIGGSFEISTLAADNAALQGHRLYPLVLVLVFAGAFTKSAQVPFHFWLPSAMEAPTPVSAYLHSATMVKAGVYLLARLSPVLGGSDIWLYVVTGFGAATMLASAYQALYQTDLKKILAYSTVSVLGTLTMLIGLGDKLAIKAAMVFLMAHVLYKAALFLVAGSIDHETGTRDIRQLGGLRKTMPIICAGAAVGALSMAGLPPFFGFVGKETLYEAVTHGNLPVTVVAVLTSMLLFAVAWLAGIRPFSGAETHTPKHPHDPPWTMWLGPVFLGCLSVLFGLMPVLPEKLLSAAASSVLAKEVHMHLALWHGFNALLVLSLVTFALGVLVYWQLETIKRVTEFALPAVRRGPSYWYALWLRFLNWSAVRQTRVLQNGYLRLYLATIMTVTAVLAWYTFLTYGDVAVVAMDWGDIGVHEWVVGLVALVGAIATVRAQTFLRAVMALG
ncbi:MAG: proton-conducting transporter membrane subunit, partial [Chloroflexota bacterium]|nr:proton-conducting transporter membrane subunit [Chloroflexota bacterium]